LQAQVEAERENFLHFMELSEEPSKIVALEDGQEVDGTMRQMVNQYDFPIGRPNFIIFTFTNMKNFY
jgi:hypothetical protein